MIRRHLGSSVFGSICILWAIFLSPFSVFAQSTSLDVSQHLATHWRAQDGFFQGNIQALAQTTDGYIWLGTGYGLLRFDGMRFTEWKSGDDSLPGRPIRSLVATKDGSLWIGGTGLSELKDGVLHKYREMDGLPVDALAEDVDGSVWAGIVGKPGQPALCRIQSRKARCFLGSAFPQVWVRSLFVDGSGRSWAGGEEGVWQIGPGPPKLITKVGAVASGINESPEGTLLLANDSALNEILSSGTVKQYMLPPQQKPVDAVRLLRTSDGALWVGTLGHGIVHYHDGRVDSYSIGDGLPTASITAMMQDREGNVWIAAESSLNRFRRPAVATFSTKQGLANEQVFSVLSNDDGSTWVGTLTGLNRLVGSTFAMPLVKLPSNTITSLFRTHEGKLLVATASRDGMVWLDRTRAVPLEVHGGENVFGITSGSKGEIWVDSQESGLQHISAAGELLESWPWGAVGLKGHSLAFDPKRDGVWLGGSQGELGLFKGGKIVERYGPLNGLGDGTIRDIGISSDGSVWFTSRKGLARLFHGHVNILGSKNGLPCDGVHWMRHADDGTVWLYAECGLVQLAASDLDRWVTDSAYRVPIMRWLASVDGIENTPFGDWYSPEVAVTKDGRILFAMSTGLGVIDGHSGLKNALPPPVKIETVVADGRSVDIEREALLPKRTKKVQFSFTALSFSSPERTRFRYQLEGFDNAFSEPAMLREAEYTSLPPGHYRFHVTACTNEGVCNNTGVALPIYIAPAFDQTFSFKLLIAALSVCGLLAAYHYRTNYLLRQAKERLHERLSERERIARDLHDTFFQGIQGLLLRFNTGTSQLPPNEPARQIFIATLEQSDQVMLEGRKLVLDLRDPNESSVLEDALAQVGEELSPQHSIRFELIVLGNSRITQPTAFRELYSLGREALYNAFRHSNATLIELELHYNPESLTLRVRDDGDGMEEDVVRDKKRAGHWGLPGMYERAEKLGGTVTLWSKIESGTEIEVTVPGTVYRKANTPLVPEWLNRWLRPRRSTTR